MGAGGQTLGEPRSPQAMAQLAGHAGHISQPVGEVTTTVSSDTEPPDPAGQKRGEGDGLGVGDQIPRQDPPPLRILARRHGRLQPHRPQALLGPHLRPPPGCDRLSNLERRSSDGRAAHQPPVIGLRLDHLRTSGQPDDTALDARHAHQPAPVTWADSLVRRQVHPGWCNATGPRSHTARARWAPGGNRLHSVAEPRRRPLLRGARWLLPRPGRQRTA